jgi:hypothetical protein
MSSRKIIKMRGKAQAQIKPAKVRATRPRRSRSQPKQQRQKRNANRRQPNAPRMPRVQAPFQSSTTTRGRNQGMKFKVVPFREELGAITGSVAFASTQYPINPGQALSFPWLALEAKQWEKYRIRKLCYEYTPQVTEFSTNGIGSLVIGFDADASDAPPNDLIHALNCDPRSFNLPCKKVVLDVPPRYLNSMTDGYYVRPGNLPGQSDIKTYDTGNINISTVGQASVATIGILAVSYIVEFFIPILEPNVGAPVNNSVTEFQTNGTEASGTTTVAKIIALASTLGNGLGATNAGGSITLPAGNYMFYAHITFQSAAVDLDNITLDLQRGGTSVFTTQGIVPQLGPVSGPTGQDFMTLSFAEFIVNSAATNAYTLVGTAAFTGGGTSNVSGSLVILAV